MAPVLSCTTPYSVAVITCARTGDEPASADASTRAMGTSRRKLRIRTSKVAVVLNGAARKRSRSLRSFNTIVMRCLCIQRRVCTRRGANRNEIQKPGVNVIQLATIRVELSCVRRDSRSSRSPRLHLHTGKNQIAARARRSQRALSARLQSTDAEQLFGECARGSGVDGGATIRQKAVGGVASLHLLQRARAGGHDRFERSGPAARRLQVAREAGRVRGI